MINGIICKKNVSAFCINKTNKHYLNKENSGITLIALVITIIVLLILAGVTIAMLSGENGIITRAQQTMADNQITSVQELLSVNFSGKISEYYDKKYVQQNDENIKLEDAYNEALALVVQQKEDRIDIINDVRETDDGKALEGTIKIKDTYTNRSSTASINGSVLTWSSITDDE